MPPATAPTIVPTLTELPPPPVLSFSVGTGARDVVTKTVVNGTPEGSVVINREVIVAGVETGGFGGPLVVLLGGGVLAELTLCELDELEWLLLLLEETVTVTVLVVVTVGTDETDGTASW